MGYVISWFEIPTTNIQRAAKFYGEVLACEIPIYDVDGVPKGFFPSKDGAVTGALIQAANQVPSQSGTTVYFYIEDGVGIALSRVEPAGGQVLSPKSFISKQIGSVAIFKDTEGNRVALHSMKQ